MLKNIVKRILLFLCLIFVANYMSAQQVTKEQLLKLFYEAHTAQANNNVNGAIDAYGKILKLSPGLPDPYLQLGHIYSTMTTDAAAMEKACVCYSNYLRLKPEAVNADELKAKITELTNAIRQLDNRGELIAVNIPEKPAKKIVTLGKKIQIEELADTCQMEETKTEETIASTLNVVKDTQPKSSVVLNDTLLGRWVSASLGHNGREEWILDISKEGADYFFTMNDSSYVKKNDEVWKNASRDKAQAYVQGDEVVVTYEIEQKDGESASQKSVLGQFLDNLWDVNIDLDLFTESEEGKVKNETGRDSTSVMNSLITDVYQFRLLSDGFKLNGKLIHQVIRKDSVEHLLSEQIDSCEFFKAPDDYCGFVYKPVITDTEKSNMMEFRQLFHQKLQEEQTGSTSAINDLGCMYASGVGVRRNMKMAVAYFMKASMKQNLFGLLNMAQLYVDGLGVEKDLEKARAYYVKAFEQKYSDAMVMCGDTYLISATTSEDYTNALNCYLEAVRGRSPYAYYRLGWLYKEGLGVEKDPDLALEYYLKAVAMQYPSALADVGLFYLKGEMIERDVKKAMELLYKGAELGNSKAMYELYQIFLRGEEGIVPNFKYAKDWYHKSLRADEKVLNGYSTLKSQIKTILSTKNREK